MSIDRNTVIEFLHLQEVVKAECLRVCEQLYRLDPDCIHQSLAGNVDVKLEYFDDKEFTVEASETWGCGGYDEHRKTLPTDWLTSENWQAEVVAKKSAKDARKLKDEKVRADARLKAERSEYERLAKKFAAKGEDR